jgi:hypothetical protein
MGLQTGDVLRVSVRAKSNSSKDVVNVYHYGQTGVCTATNEELLGFIEAHLGTAYANIEEWQAAAAVPYDVKVDRIEYSGGKIVIAENIGVIPWTTEYNPTGSGDAYAPAVSVLLILRTLVGKVFGRKFIGMLTESALTYIALQAGGVASSFADLIAGLLSSITDGGTGLDLTPGVLSTSAAHYGEFLPFTSGEVASEPAYQRRRKVNVGS